MEKRVTGIGGIFFKCSDTEKVKDWYNKHLGIPTTQWGAMFEWRDKDDKEKMCTTTWSPFSSTTKHFSPSEKPFMFNYRVANLDALLKALKTEGVEQVGEMQTFEYGKFAWIMDCDGNKIELWEPIDEPIIEEDKKNKN
ncbi:MAG TPA: VOC family protein [Flavobacteriales bacterium]|nr:VOC family protein [Flavobacteriales bacterium]